MINLPLVRRTIRDYALLWLGAAVLLTLFMIFFNFALNSMPIQDSARLLRMPWVRSLISALVGSDIGEFASVEGLLSLSFSHPFVWVLLVSFSLTLSSGALAGEVDRGTMDVLAALPISRTRLYASLSAALVAAMVPLCWFVWLGARLGLLLIGNKEVDPQAFAAVTCNLCAVVLLVSFLGLAISAAASRRGAAVVAAFVVVFYSFVLNFFAAMWPALRPLAPTSFLHYYTPLVIVRDGAWPWRNMAILLAVAAVFWLIGLVAFTKRDIPAR